MVNIGPPQQFQCIVLLSFWQHPVALPIDLCVSVSGGKRGRMHVSTNLQLWLKCAGICNQWFQSHKLLFNTSLMALC